MLLTAGYGPFVRTAPRSLLRRPVWPWRLNERSWQAHGLVAWYSFPPWQDDALDFAAGQQYRLTRNGPVWVADPEMGMVPEFDDAASQYFESNVIPIAGYPFTVAVWGRPDDVTIAQAAWWSGDKDVANVYFELGFDGVTAGDPAFFRARNTTIRDAQSTTAFVANVWQHICGVAVSATDRAVFLNAGSKGTSTLSVTAGALDRTTVGRAGDSTPDTYMSGRIADVRVYNRALSDPEVAALYDPRQRWDLCGAVKRYFVFPRVTGQTIAVGQVTETDLAQAVAWAPKHRLVSQVIETDTPQGVTARKTLSLVQVTEADLAQALSVRKSLTLGQPPEIDIAQSVTRSGQTIPVDQTLEADLAQAVSSRKAQTLGQSVETDLAQPATWSLRRLVGQVLESDLAQAILALLGGATQGTVHYGHQARSRRSRGSHRNR